MSQSVDSMLGILNNANQTATLLESNRNAVDSLRSANERNLSSILQGIATEAQKTDNLISMNNNFANQNLSTVSASLKDLIQATGSVQLSATERTGAAGVATTDRIGSLLSHSIERIGGDNINATDRNGSMISHSLERIGSDNINATERNGSANLIASERIGGVLANLANQNNSILMNGIRDTEVTNERNFGETRLFNSTGFQNLERRVGDYYVNTEKNFGRIESDMIRVENSLGRLADNHHNSSMIELLKTHAAIDKSIDRNEINIIRQASDNYANIQIEAAKNKLALEQKISDIGNDIKLTLLKDNNDTRNLITGYNNDNIRNDLQSERIIHALHHHHNHHDDRHHHRDHHYGSHFFPYPYQLPNNMPNQQPH